MTRTTHDPQPPRGLLQFSTLGAAIDYATAHGGRVVGINRATHTATMNLPTVPGWAAWDVEFETYAGEVPS